MDDSELGEIGSLSTLDCFRCKGLAVIDPSHIRLLPFWLAKARYLLMKTKLDNPEDNEKSWATQAQLKLYEDLIEGMNINGRSY